MLECQTNQVYIFIYYWLNINITNDQCMKQLQMTVCPLLTYYCLVFIYRYIYVCVCVFPLFYSIIICDLSKYITLTCKMININNYKHYQ